MPVTSRLIEYDVDGETFEGVFYVDDTVVGARPAVIVCHAWSGRQPHEEEAAKRYAEMGYVGFAADVYGKGVRGTTIEENQALMTPLVEDRAKLHRRLMAALDVVNDQPEVNEKKVAVTGYCFGGLCALDYARVNAPILGAAAFHSVFGDPLPDQKDEIRAKVIAFQGYDDPMADPDAQRQFTDEMTGRKADWQLHLFGGVGHAFTNKDADKPDMGLIYDPAADDRSWRGATSFLKELFD